MNARVPGITEWSPARTVLARRSGLLALSLALACASGADAKRDVEAALQRYNDALARNDADGMVSMFTPDGETSWAEDAPIRGSDAIRAHLRRFAEFRVESSRMRTDSLVVTGPAARQEGTFWQRTRLPDGKVVEAQGRFTVEWTRGADGRWLVRRLVTRPP